MHTAQRLRYGLSRGLLCGVVFAGVESLQITVTNKVVRGLAWSVFDREPLQLLGWTIGLCVLLGVLSVLVHAFQPRPHPARLPLEIGLGLVLLTLGAILPELDRRLLGSLMVVVVSSGLSVGLNILWARRPLVLLPALGLLAGIWLTGVLWRVPPQSSGQDAPRPQARAGLPNILWIVLDTVRADHLPLYGYGPQTAPQLGVLASQGVTFERAFATAPWSLPSTASMFTGLSSSQHGCHHEHLYLDAGHQTVAEQLSAAGYDTALFAANPWLGPQSGLQQGFSYVLDTSLDFLMNEVFVVGRLRARLRQGNQDKGSRQSTDALLGWLKQREAGRPYFVFLNYFEAHAAYHQVPGEDALRFLPPGVSVSEARAVSQRYMSTITFSEDWTPTPREQTIAKALYDGGIYYEDRLLAELLENLKRDGQLENTLIVVHSDHGEMFGEHGLFGHDLWLYRSLLHVPLVISWPGKVPAGVRIPATVSLIDLYPTLLEAAGLKEKLSPTLRGTSLLATMQAPPADERPVFAEVYRPSVQPLRQKLTRMGLDAERFRLKSVIEGKWHFLSLATGQGWLFDMQQDPEELVDVSARQPELALRLRERLETFSRENPRQLAGGSGEPALDALTKEKMRSMGYFR